jgi:hypothetical protein
MAVIQPTIAEVKGFQSLDGYQVIWGPMQGGDVGAAVGTTISGQTPAPGGGMAAGFADKSIQAVGNFTAGASVACEGSNDGGANWFALSDPLGNVIALTAAAMKEVTEAVIWVRPRVAAGDGSTVITVTMFLRKTNTP